MAERIVYVLGANEGVELPIEVPFTVVEHTVTAERDPWDPRSSVTVHRYYLAVEETDGSD